ncbi:MAG: hypothetical protein FJX75_28850 [Armatimonadetes bacterium]|nr:hypothetical protein [Armatimonadota bacterium]
MDAVAELAGDVARLRDEVSRLKEQHARMQQQMQQAQEFGGSPMGEFTAPPGAGGQEDPLGLALEGWERRPPSEQLRLEGQAATVALRELDHLPPSPERRPDYLVVCGRNPDGSLRVVWSGDEFPTRERERAAEAEYGLKAWRVATFGPGEAEEQDPIGHQRGPGPGRGAGLRWAAGLRRWASREGREVPEPSPNDRYPVVQVRVSWAAEPADRAALFTADLDTGAPHCVFPLEHLQDALGDTEVLDHAVAQGLQAHLRGHWLCWALSPRAFRFEVRTASGWREFQPERGEACATPIADWNDQTFCRVRAGRQAFVGRPIWRGQVKLTLGSTSADWESAPPVTY